MLTLNLKLVVLTVFFSISIQSWANDYKVLKVCLTGATEKTIPHYGDAFYQGALLAYEKLPKNLQQKIEIVTDYYDPKPLAAFHKVKDLLLKRCSVIVGFSTGNDLLAANMQIEKTPILVISIYGDPHPDLKKSKSIITLQPGPEELLGHTLNNAEIAKGASALVVTAVDRSEMKYYQDVFKRLGQSRFSKVDYVDVLESDQKISHVEDILRNNSYEYLVLLTRSSLAAQITDRTKGRDVKVLGTKYFGSAELPAYLNFLSNKNISAYFSRQNQLDLKDEKIREFYSGFEKRFKKSPMIISMESFNIINYLTLFLDLTDSYSPDEVIRAVNSSEKSFFGIGGVEANPLKNLKHTGRYFLKVTSSGYEVVK